jgi:hypothetical protein
MRLVHRACKYKSAKFEPFLMILADSTAVAKFARTLIPSKSSTQKTACLDLKSGPQPLQGIGKHVVKSDLAQPVPCAYQAHKGAYQSM